MSKTHVVPNEQVRTAANDMLTQAQFEWFRDRLANYGGVFLDPGQRHVLSNGLNQRLAALGTTLDQYLELLRGSNSQIELQRLIELILNHETFFFRNRPHLRALQDVLLPELHRRKVSTRPIRIWSAGCASGEEAYSIAITVLEALGQPLPRPVEIIATDLSEAALQRAQAGIYRGRTLQHLSADLLARYFEPHGESYRIGAAARRLVRFQHMNLLDPFPPELHTIDAIFCQNVTIYFQDAVRRRLIERFYSMLPIGGLLFLGFSETLWNVFSGFRAREISGAYVYYKESQHTTLVPEQKQSTKLSTHKTERSNPPATRVARPKLQEQRASDEGILNQARDLIRTGQLSEAIDVLRRIAPHSACAPLAISLAARAHADRGDLELAEAEALRAIEIDPLNDDCYLLLGIVYSRQEQWRLAIQQLDRARYLRPESALISFHLATAHRELGQPETARREYRSTLWKLREHPPDMLIDGVAVAWLRETCEHQIQRLARGISE
jgi:chemotaxis protein methyltransferase CheR